MVALLAFCGGREGGVVGRLWLRWLFVVCGDVGGYGEGGCSLSVGMLAIVEKVVVVVVGVVEKVLQCLTEGTVGVGVLTGLPTKI